MASTRRNALVAVVAACALSLGLSATASAADVAVEQPRGGGLKSQSFDSLQGKFDVDAYYEIRQANGQTANKRVQGISVRALLDALDVDETYGAIEVPRASGGIVRISRAQVDAAGETPVVFEEGGALHFLRPSYSSGDANAADEVVASGTLLLRQVSSSPLVVEARASKVKIKAGQVVRFSATASGAGAGEKYEFRWNFDDGKRGSGAGVSHRFTKRGRYTVLATVSTPGSGRSDPDIVTVQVGEPVKSKKDQPGGGTNDAAGAPVSGQADGDSGAGDAAGSTEPAAKPRKKRKPAQSVPAGATVTGQLIDPTQVEEVEEPTSLAARSGQAKAQDSAGGGIPGEAVGAAGFLGLIGFGILLELGTLGRLGTRIRP